jgi:uncharacterized protein
MPKNHYFYRIIEIAMNSRKILLLSIFTCLILAPSYPGFAQQKNIDKLNGSWVGKLKIKTVELTLVINIASNDRDSLTVTIDSPDQGATGLPTSRVTYTKDSLVVESGRIGLTYKGRFDPDYTTLTGMCYQSGLTLPLELKHSEKKFELNRPQEPKPPFPYIVKDVQFSNKEGYVELVGTLTIPKGKGPFPAVVLISGSGPQNRDEEIFGHKPFLVLADYLTRHGIAVLRYDDRGVSKSTGSFTTATTYDFATDASAAVDFLRTQPSIDTGKIGLIGHSEGGMIAPMLASGRDDMDFIVLMAGPGITGAKILIEQTEVISRANGLSEQEIAEARKLNEQVYDVLKKNSDDVKAGEKIKKLLTDYNEKKTGKAGNRNAPDLQIDNQVKTLTSPWYRYFISFDPLDFLPKVKCPLLAVNGELDMQVGAKENLEAIEKAMIYGGNSKYTVTEIPGVNHLFQTAKTGSPNEYSKIEETMSPIVLELICNWILKETK